MEDCYKDGYNYSLRLLSRQNYTVFKLGKKLTDKGFTECKQSIIDALKQKGFLNDTLYAKRFIEMKDQTSPFGEYVLKQKLREKGIHPDVTIQILESMERNENELSFFALRKKFKYKLPEIEKALRYLASRGFNYGIARNAWEQFSSDLVVDKYK